MSFIGKICLPLNYLFRSFLVTWSAALQIAWNKKKVLTCENSSIPTEFFWYTNMAADSLFCTQIWPPSA